MDEMYCYILVKQITKPSESAYAKRIGGIPMIPIPYKFILEDYQVRGYLQKMNEWSAESDLAEQLLISVHKPAYNSKSLYAFNNPKFQDIHILNWGNHKNLLPEVSGLRWTSKLDNINYEIYKL